MQFICPLASTELQEFCWYQHSFCSHTNYKSGSVGQAATRSSDLIVVTESINCFKHFLNFKPVNCAINSVELLTGLRLSWCLNALLDFYQMGKTRWVYNLGIFLKLAEIRSPDVRIYGPAESGGGLRLLWNSVWGERSLSIHMSFYLSKHWLISV